MFGQGDDPIGAILDDARHAQHLVLARTARRVAAEDACWHWFSEWRLCLLSPRGRDALLPCYWSEVDQRALFGDSPAILQERRVDVAPDGTLHPRPWQSYPPAATPLEAIEHNGTRILRAEEGLAPLHALAVARWQRSNALMAERRRLVQERERTVPPNRETGEGQDAERRERNERFARALKQQRLYAPWQRAQKDAALRERLQPQVQALLAQVVQEQAAAREQCLAELARLDAQIAALDAELEELREAPAEMSRCLG